MFTRNSVKKSFFPGDLEGAKSLEKKRKEKKNGIIFAIILCQRVVAQICDINTR